ncbi:hypothetical protein [Rothia aeria]|jgi:hypothetical protein|uniref:hypothetical protein n=1 Tax=Rothia aeria TaxID=172042 RepID=UPI00254C93F7|nr:hypothetical protein [Rothia aeria]MDK7353951.1 hypothetical protein [Rothia aeria]
MLAKVNSLLMDTAVVLADVPNPGQGQAPPGSEGVTTVLGWIAWVVFALAVVGVLITAGAMMLNNRRGQGGEHAAALGWVFAGCIIAASASAIVGMFVR